MVDKLLYVDTDILFLTSLEGLWRLFDAFNATQLAAVAPEAEDHTANWYTRFARHPFYLPYGLFCRIFYLVDNHHIQA